MHHGKKYQSYRWRLAKLFCGTLFFVPRAERFVVAVWRVGVRGKLPPPIDSIIFTILFRDLLFIMRYGAEHAISTKHWQHFAALLLCVALFFSASRICSVGFFIYVIFRERSCLPEEQPCTDTQLWAHSTQPSLKGATIRPFSPSLSAQAHGKRGETLICN
jgi:hypothetical protein